MSVFPKITLHSFYDSDGLIGFRVHADDTLCLVWHLDAEMTETQETHCFYCTDVSGERTLASDPDGDEAMFVTHEEKEEIALRDRIWYVDHIATFDELEDQSHTALMTLSRPIAKLEA